jgi:hypothetical protein
MSEDFGLFPVREQLLAAPSHRDRAAILLRAPDGMVLEKGEAMAEACRRVGFDHGADFIAIRLTGLHRVRDASGLLPQMPAALLEAYRLNVLGVAEGAAP